MSLEEKYAEIFSRNGINDEIERVVVRSSGLAGEHFASITELATVEFKNGIRKPINLFVKKILPCQDGRALEMENLMIKEGTFLTTIVDELSQKNDRYLIYSFSHFNFISKITVNQPQYVQFYEIFSPKRTMQIK
jgi:hypothetical protein